MRKTTPLIPLTWDRPLRITPAKRKTLLANRDAWLREIDPTDLFYRLFDLIPGVYFFAKNRQGELMFTCRASRELYHFNDETTCIGLTDFDVNPSEMAEAYAHDDARLYATGKPVLNRIELWFDEQGMPDWFVVNKLPIHSRDGKIIGIMGFSQSYRGRAELLEPFKGISRAVNYLRENYHQDLAIGELARLAGLSLRQLQRKFKATFGVGPQQFLIKTRLLAACRALRQTEHTQAEIAFSCGFTDQSAFARHFRHHFRLTPSAFRKQLAEAEAPEGTNCPQT
ncbi:MAG: helix-turn-helix domain-containing protein [Verrucomicrobiota bacterium]